MLLLYYSTQFENFIWSHWLQWYRYTNITTQSTGRPLGSKLAAQAATQKAYLTKKYYFTQIRFGTMASMRFYFSKRWNTIFTDEVKWLSQFTFLRSGGKEICFSFCFFLFIFTSSFGVTSEAFERFKIKNRISNFCQKIVSSLTDARPCLGCLNLNGFMLFIESWSQMVN